MTYPWSQLQRIFALSLTHTHTYIHCRGTTFVWHTQRSATPAATHLIFSLSHTRAHTQRYYIYMAYSTKRNASCNKPNGVTITFKPKMNGYVRSWEVFCNTLQHTATHCNILQHIATYCNTLQHTDDATITFQPKMNGCARN